MNETTPGPLNNVITIDDERMRIPTIAAGDSD
jgi:hypothetical protein